MLHFGSCDKLLGSIPKPFFQHFDIITGEFGLPGGVLIDDAIEGYQGIWQDVFLSEGVLVAPAFEAKAPVPLIYIISTLCSERPILN